jgi:hypothetical protein
VSFSSPKVVLVRIEAPWEGINNIQGEAKIRRVKILSMNCYMVSNKAHCVAQDISEIINIHTGCSNSHLT